MGVPLAADASAVAQNAGIQLYRKGSRQWACCPLHNEKTPSMCFFPDGRFHCFGCGAHGDAADLYAALHGVTLAEALRIVKGGSHKAVLRVRMASDLRLKVEEWKSKVWSQNCTKLHNAHALINQLANIHTPKELADMEAFWNAAECAAAAKDTLNLLESASPAQLLKMSVEDQ